jgi:hypothetical protein
MMLPTHALAGMVLGLPVALAAPEFATPALLAGFVGGVLPDLDLYAGHRRTLHYPVYYPLLAALAAVVAAIAPSTASVAAAVLLAGAAAHSVADVAGGGLELRPWEATSERAVFDHARGQWLAPRRWVPYDGAPEDLLSAVAIAVPLWMTVTGTLRLLVAASVVVAAVYAAVRRRLPAAAERIVERALAPAVPASLLAYLPARYRETARSRHGPEP